MDVRVLACVRACVHACVCECFHASVRGTSLCVSVYEWGGEVLLQSTILAPRVRICMYGLPYLEMRVQA